MTKSEVLNYIRQCVNEYYSENSIIKKSNKELKELTMEEKLRINIAIEESGVLDIIAQALLKNKE